MQLKLIESKLKQISYPLEPKSGGPEGRGLIKEQIYNLMRFLDLNHILDRIGFDFDKDLEWNWNDCLSPGEQQRVGFVRLFYHRPLLAVLDESTSAVSLDMERKIYEECKRLQITLISCGHRQSLREYHSKVLTIFKRNNSEVNEYITENL